MNFAMLMVLAVVVPPSAPLDAGVAKSNSKLLTARPVDVTAQKLEVRVKENRAIYTGNAKAVRDTSTLICDSMTVEFLPGGSDVSRIFAQGHCHAVDGDRQATGETVEYFNDTGLMIVRGEPHAIQGSREVTGEEVRFTTGDERLVVTKAKTKGEQTSPKGTELVTIDADQLEFFQQQSVAVWSGNVHAHRGATLMTAPEMQATWDEKGDITTVETHKGMEATEGNRWVSGRHAVYTAATGVLVLTGNPQARQGTSRMKGTRIKFTSGTDVLDVENAVTLLQVDKKKPMQEKKK